MAQCGRCGRKCENDKELEYIFAMIGDVLDQHDYPKMRAKTHLCNTCRKFLENDFRLKLTQLLYEYDLQDDNFLNPTGLKNLSKTIGLSNDTPVSPKSRFKVVKGGRD